MLAQVSERHKTVWEPRAGGPELEGHSAVWDPEKWQNAGIRGTVRLSRIFQRPVAYDPGADTWSTVTASGTPPSARHGHTAVMETANGRMYVFGGRGAEGALNDCYKFDISTDTWSQVTTTGTIRSGDIATPQCSFPALGRGC